VIRQKLGLVFGSAEMVLIHLSTFVPSNAFRVFSLRLWGASVGSNVAIHHGLQVRAARRLVLGDDCFVAENVILDARGGLTIGSHVSVNSGAHIWTAQHDLRSPSFAYEASPVVVGDRAWVSARSTVLPGVTVGEGAVIAAGAVLSKNADSWTVVGGVPAKRIADRPVVDQYLLNASQNKVWWW